MVIDHQCKNCIIRPLYYDLSRELAIQEFDTYLDFHKDSSTTETIKEFEQSSSNPQVYTKRAQSFSFVFMLGIDIHDKSKKCLKAIGWGTKYERSN